MMNLQQIGLNSLKIKDKLIIDSILNSKETMLSAYAFASHYVWRDIFHFYWSIIDDCLCIFSRCNDYLYMPVPPVQRHSSFPASRSAEAFHKTITTVFSIMDRINKNKAVSRIENISECERESYITLGYDVRAGESEYVYLRENLVNLKGNPYKSKRAMCNYFARHYKYSYESFQPTFVFDCIRLYDNWQKERGKKIDDPIYHALLEDSSFAHKQALRHYKALQLTGRIIRINERVEGYIFGFNRKDTFYVLLEVANPDNKGLAQIIFREFCREMNDYTYINTLGDSGLENLRRVKLSYRPLKTIPSYIAYQP